MDILPVLMELGFDYGEPVLDCPWTGQEAPRPFLEDCSFVRPGDMLLQTTRPPLDDLGEGDRKGKPETYSELEGFLFAAWRNYLQYCARSRVTLHKRLRQKLSPPYDTRRNMQFFEAEGARYKAFNNFVRPTWRTPDPENAKKTAAFLLRLEEAWDGGPGLISAFGMDATTTAVWCYRLGRDFAHLLAKPGFVLVDMTNAGIPARPTNMRWAADWPIDIVLQST
jgi:hypothetical protein